jgi:mannitol-1-/sugar-/sorbitol-6-phosphatase
VAPHRDRRFAAFLFDMDGTILDSLAVANRVWSGWAERHGLDAAPILAAMHGVQAIQTVRRFAPAGVDAAAEAEAITRAEVDDVDGIVEIAGARRFLSALPAHRWAVVTSAPRRLAVRRLEAARLPMPDVLVTADETARGKPAPDCFIAAAAALGVDARDCLVWEDAPAGIAAAEAAGASVVVVGATHAHRLDSVHPMVRDYAGLGIGTDDSGWLRLTAA